MRDDAGVTTSAASLAAAAAAPGHIPEDDSIDLLRIVVRLTAAWRTGLVTAALVFFVAAVLILRIHPKYEATAVILPRDQVSAPTSLTALFTGARPGSAFLSLLVSRTLQNDVLRRTGLRERLQIRSEEDGRGALTAMTKVLPTVEGTLIITIRNRDAALAARIADSYVDALRSMQESMASAQAEIRRRYFEQQIQREKDALALAEDDLQRTQEGSGVVQAETQTQIGLSAIAGVRAEITALQVRLAALLQSATEQNPEVRILRSQIAQLQGEEHSMEAGARGRTGVGAAPSAGRMPGVNLAYQRKQREVRYHETLVTSLASHFEDLRLADVSLGDNFDVIDRAVVPEQPTWPPRRLFLLLALAAALLAGLLAIVCRLVVARILADPVQHAYLRQIAANFRRRPRRA